ncbi:hypothetical protein [Allorhizocola rhizosphaerae]|uniref:hypothetical protein n=1 Tax=Allorhizocola rhizosphaerae TaxID=1872709 RepID=UPI000E3D1F96|nr:hypothetical protein [Allorhizocola rhizosphaerae]
MSFDGTRHRALMAMAAAGVLTALAPAPALADNGQTDSLAALNASVMDVGIRTAVGDRVVEAAYTELNSDRTREWGDECNFYSAHFYGAGRCQYWCADFVKFVWKNAGVYAWEHLDSEAGTTARYGKFFGTWHPGREVRGIYPGAAVTYNKDGDPLVDSDHVGVFVGWVDGAPKVISGNFNDTVYKHNLNYSANRPIAGWTGVG